MQLLPFGIVVATIANQLQESRLSSSLAVYLFKAHSQTDLGQQKDQEKEFIAHGWVSPQTAAVPHHSYEATVFGSIY